jgi:hypothetical protein
MKRFALLSQLCLAFVFAETPELVSDEAQALPVLNENIAEIITLLQKDEMNRDCFALIFKDGEPADFDGGSYLFINASEIKIAVQIGRKKFELNPSEQKLLQPTATHEGGGCQVTLSYQREAKWKVFKDTRWSTNKRYRSLIFFHQHPVSGQLMVSPVVDLLAYNSPNTG